jgi:hypothetical protein
MGLLLVVYLLYISFNSGLRQELIKSLHFSQPLLMILLLNCVTVI